MIIKVDYIQKILSFFNDQTKWRGIQIDSETEQLVLDMTESCWCDFVSFILTDSFEWFEEENKREPLDVEELLEFLISKI